jgi:hypothetical protein
MCVYRVEVMALCYKLEGCGFEPVEVIEIFQFI